jgi:hypothetical protein
MRLRLAERYPDPIYLQFGENVDDTMLTFGRVPFKRKIAKLAKEVSLSNGKYPD